MGHPVIWVTGFDVFAYRVNVYLLVVTECWVQRFKKTSAGFVEAAGKVAIPSRENS